MHELENFTKILLGSFKKIGVMAGAGISVNAGIPDFRSKSGIYHKLTSPQSIFNIHHFRKNPQDFYDIAPKIMVVDAVPTLTHCFIAFLEHKKVLKVCFSQNVDGLEKKAGVLKLVQAHGNAEKAECAVCYKEHDRKMLVEAMKKSKPMYCECKGPVKPSVVFFGEKMSENYEKNLELIRDIDLLLVLGTSLAVQPFASLVQEVGNVPRVVINKVNLKSYLNLGFNFQPGSKDLLFQSDSDVACRRLLEVSGWQNEFLEKFPNFN